MSGNWLEGRICLGCGDVLRWQRVDPPWEGWWECSAGDQWRVDATGQLRPRSQVPVLYPTTGGPLGPPDPDAGR